MAYKIGQRVNVINRHSTFPQDNVGVIRSVVISYIVKLDGGMVRKCTSEEVSKVVTANKEESNG